MMITLCTLQAVAETVPSPTNLLWSLWAWLYLHWVIVLAVAAWLVVNVVPRPHPDQLVGWKRIAWKVVDLLCFLTAAKLPGALKWPATASPPLVVPADDRVVIPTDVVVKDGEDKTT